MTLATRRLIYISFILIFLIATPLIILYASGYKIGAGFKIQKTGALIIDTEPRGANIYLNGKLQGDPFAGILRNSENRLLTPAKAKNLLPGEYKVELELNGYWGWEKRLTVKPNESTYIEDVVLFRNNLPELITGGNFQAIEPAPDGNFLAALDGKISLIDLAQGAEIAATSVPENVFASSGRNWSPDGKKFLAGNYIYSYDNQPEILKTGTKIATGTSSFFWAQDSNSIYYAGKNGVFEYDIDIDRSAEIIKTGADDIMARDNMLFYISSRPENSVLAMYDLDGKKNIGQINMPASQYVFIHPGHKLINLLDKRQDTLYIIDRDQPVRPIKGKINGVKYSQWLDDNRLVYANDFEIYLYDLNYDSSQLLTRISSQIKNIAIHPSKNYIIYSTPGTIQVLELDDRDKHNITRLVELDAISGLYLNDDGNELYFIAKIGNNQGLYKLTIQ